MPSTLYRDFELEIGASSGSGYPTTVRSPAGDLRQPFVLPFAPEELATWQRRLEALVIRGADQTRHLRVQLQTPEDDVSPRQFGAALFNAVFTGNALSLFDTSRALARRDGAGLRLRLRILAPKLATLPWELLYDPRQRE